MAILIKDMEMPESCDACKFHCYHSNGEYVCVATPLLYPFNLANSKGIRKNWCPLVEVPEPYVEHLCEDEVISCLEGADWINEIIRTFLDSQAEGTE